jgi:hypothetical protein
MTTTSTSPLASAGATGSLAITAAGVAAGTSGLPVFVGAPNAAQPGIYLSASPDFVGNWSLYRHASGFRADAAGIPQIVLSGDNTFIILAPPSALANLSGMDSIALVVTARTAGSLVLSVVQ